MPKPAKSGELVKVGVSKNFTLRIQCDVPTEDFKRLEERAGEQLSRLWDEKMLGLVKGGHVADVPVGRVGGVTFISNPGS